MRDLKRPLKKSNNSSPDPDQIHYENFLRYLPIETFHILLDTMNGTWKSDSFPESWREALIISIPKPGKASHSLLCQWILLSGSHPAIEVDDSAQGLGDYPWRLIKISVPHHSNYDCIPSNPRNLFHGAPVEHGSDLCCAIFRSYQGGSTWWMKNTKISGCTLHGRWRKLLGIYINSGFTIIFQLLWFVVWLMKAQWPN